MNLITFLSACSSDESVENLKVDSYREFLADVMRAKAAGVGSGVYKSHPTVIVIAALRSNGKQYEVGLVSDHLDREADDALTDRVRYSRRPFPCFFPEILAVPGAAA